MKKIFFIFCFLFCVLSLKFEVFPVFASWEDEAMIPFWQGNTIFNESMLMVSYNGGVPESPFLFPYINIISVKNSALDLTYVPGKDWMFQNNKLILPTGSNIPYINSIDIPLSMTTDSVYFHNHQIAVTYTHSGSWQGPIPTPATNLLPHTIGKLFDQKPIKIVLYGDSISVGYNASELLNTEPRLPPWGQLVVNALQKKYQSNITFINSSQVSQTSSWGALNASTLVSNHSPDLVIIAFGMNDGVNMPPSIIPIDTNTFKNNLLSIINNVKSINPQAEFILVSPILMHPNFGGSIQANYKSVIQSLAQTGVSIVDMTGVHEELLKTKKFADITGNNINHPNDFLSRWYAQEIVGLFPTAIPTKIKIIGDYNDDNIVNLTDFGEWKKKYLVGTASLTDFAVWKKAYLQQ